MTQLALAIIAAGGVAGALYLLIRPEWMLVVILAMFPLEQVLQSYVPALAAHSALFNILIGIGAVLAIVLRSMKGDQIWQGYMNPMLYLALAFYALWWVGWLYSPTDYEFDIRGLSYLGLFLFLMPAQVADIQDFRKLLPGLMIFGAGICVLVLMNPSSTFTDGRLVLEIDTGQTEMSGSSLATGELGGMVALLAVLIRPSGIRPMFNALRAACFLAGMGCAIASGSRGQVLATIICGVLFFPLARRLANPRQFLTTAFGFLLVLGGIYISFNLFVGYENVRRWDVEGIADAIGGRFDMVMELLEAYLQSPGSWLLGLGTQAYLSISADLHANYVHNILAEALCEQGLVGLTLFLSVVVLGVRYGRRLLRVYANDPTMRSIAAATLALTAYTFILIMKQGSFGSGYEFTWFLLLGKFWWIEQQRAHELPDADLEAFEYGPTDASDSPMQDDADQGYALGY